MLVTPFQIVTWWEIRRPVFNAAVAAAGLLSLVLVVFVALVGERLTGEAIGLPDPPLFALFGIAAYAFAANLLYTGGWVVELVVRRVWPAEAESLATTSFCVGLLGSVLLTLFLGGLLALASAVAILTVLVGLRGV